MTTSTGDQSDPHPGGSTSSLWQATCEVPRFPKLQRSGSAEVVVVGAGIAGLSVAYHLAREGKKVVVLDDGPIGGGETGRTTAHLVYAMDDRISHLEKVHGEEGARLAVESHNAAINRIQQIAQLEEIDCDFERLDGYLMAAKPGEELDDLQRELDAAERAGVSDVSLVERAPIPGFESGTTLRFPGQGQFHPLKYLSGLANAIVHKYGGEIYCETHVEAVEGGNPCNVRVAGGIQMSASCVAVCTNASISDYVQTHAKMAPYRTFVVAAAVPRGSVDRALYWSTGWPYHYVRVQDFDPYVVRRTSASVVHDESASVVRHASESDRQTEAPTKGEILWDALIVGGEDHKTGHKDDGEDRWERIEKWMWRRWPQARQILFRWSGQVLEPNDGLAYIGRNPDGAENVYMASGDSGQGMTHGTLAGIIITDLILGRENPWAELYDPKRISFGASTVGTLAKENIDVALQYAKGYIAPDRASVRDIAPGQGRVIRRGMHKVAAYRDVDGRLYEKSAVCTHMKCIVEWNGTEKSWDCPCHGSRFDPYGAVLNGPARVGLADVEQPQGKAGPGRRRRGRVRRG